MSRKRAFASLQVFFNEHHVGELAKAPGGGISFRYNDEYLTSPNVAPVSLSLPLREDAYRGQAVAAVFENLLPDSQSLRGRIAEKVGADGTDAYSLLSQIGQDCVGALRFLPDAAMRNERGASITGQILGKEQIQQLLKNLAKSPLGLERDSDFRISVAGAQEKTALLRYKGRWMKPRGTTPTTHIIKTQIGTLPNGLDLSDSVENEFYCLKLIGAFGLPVNQASIETFGKTRALVIERFDRRWARPNRLIRLPQEDFCQAMSCPPGKKYQSEGGPGMAEILRFLQASDSPIEDQLYFLKAQILFWLMGAKDGHAKNFSLFIGPQGQFRMTPLYDVLTAQPSLDARRIERKQMKMAMSVGDRRHYRTDEIHGRHFVQTVKRAGLSASIADQALMEIADMARQTFNSVETKLPDTVPATIHRSVKKGFMERLQRIST